MVISDAIIFILSCKVFLIFFSALAEGMWEKGRWKSGWVDIQPLAKIKQP